MAAQWPDPIHALFLSLLRNETLRRQHSRRQLRELARKMVRGK